MNDAYRRTLLLIVVAGLCVYVVLHSEHAKKEEIQRMVEEEVKRRLRELPPVAVPPAPPTLAPLLSVVLSPPPKGEGIEPKPWNFSKPFKILGEACSLVPVTPPPFLNSIQKYTQCVRRRPDVVSNEIRSLKRWRGCDNPINLLMEYIEPGKNEAFRFIDIGANIGSCSLLALSAGATVIAFEPLPANLYYFHESIASLNPQWKSKLTLWPVALGAQNKTETIYTEPGNAGNSALEFPTRAKRDNSKVVQVVRLDEVIPPPRHGEGESQTSYIFKLDVQGYELHVLEGAQRLLASGAVKAIQTEISTEWLKNLGKKPSDVCAFLWNAGFEIYEETCVGTGRNSVQRGRGLTEKKCKEWDGMNAECDVVARLKR